MSSNILSRNSLSVISSLNTENRYACANNLITICVCRTWMYAIPVNVIKETLYWGHNLDFYFKLNYLYINRNKARYGVNSDERAIL